MKRKDFFKKLGLGTACAILSPKILEALDKAEPIKAVIVPRRHGMTFYADSLQREINQRYLDFTRGIERQRLFGRDSIHWTSEEIETLTKTGRHPNDNYT